MPQANLKRFDLNLLVVFLELWETRSVTRTSEKLSLTQPAVSQALKRLRTALGDDLFLQSRAGLQPTARAQQLVIPVRRALDELGGSLFAEGVFDPAVAVREFHIATSEIVELSIAPLLAKALRDEAPNVVLRLRAMPDTRTACTMLEDGDLQLILSTRDIQGQAIQNETLGEVPLVALLATSIGPAARVLPMSLYLSIPHVVMQPLDHRGSIVDHVLARQGLRRPIAAVVQNYMVMALVAAQCGYICHLPKAAATQFAGILGLTVYDLPIEVPPSQLIMTSHTRFQSDPGVAWLSARASEILKNWQLDQ